MSTKYLLILSVALFVQFSGANVIRTETAATTKKEFGKNFEKEINEVGLNLLNAVEDKITVFLKAVIADLPEQDDRATILKELLSLFEKYVDDVNEIMKKKEDIHLVVERAIFLFYDARKVLEMESEKISAADFLEILKKHDSESLKLFVKDHLVNYFKGITEKWNSLYENLDEGTIKAYPDFTNINNLFKQLTEQTVFEEKSSTFKQVQSDYMAFFEFNSKL